MCDDNIRSAYNWFDCGTSHCSVDTAYANCMGFKDPLCRRLRVHIAGDEIAEVDCRQSCLNASIRWVTSNHVNIPGWYTIFDLGDIYDLIVAKDWMAANLHIIDHKTSILHLLVPDWTNWQQGAHRLSTTIMISMVGLRPHWEPWREGQAYCRMVDHRIEINIVPASFITKCNSAEICIVNIWECIAKVMEEEEETTPHKPADLVTWQLGFSKAFAELFELPLAIPPALWINFRIDTDSTVKPPHYHTYHLSDFNLLKFKPQPAKILANGWATDSHCWFAAPVIFINDPGRSGFQMCIDYTGLNAITTREWYQLPYIEDLIDRLHCSRVFTKLDRATAYHQCCIRPGDRHMTAIVHPDGFNEWTVIMFGLANMPSAFMHAMHCIVGPPKIAIV